METPEDFSRLADWILATIVLYNILLGLNDVWEPEDADIGDDNWENILPTAAATNGNNLRATVQLNLLNWFYNNN